MKTKEEAKQTQMKITSTIHHVFKLKSQDQQKNKVYFARLRGYRDRQ